MKVSAINRPHHPRFMRGSGLYLLPDARLRGHDEEENDGDKMKALAKNRQWIPAAACPPRRRGAGMTILFILALAFATPAFAADKNESVHHRVIRTNTIRCGYFVWPPFFAVDPNTGGKSGIFYDVMEAMGKKLEIKIDWAQELNFGTYLEDLETGKYDMECTGGWPTATRGKFASYSNPLFYIPLVAFVRADDTRFDKNVNAANAPEIKVSVIDGENSQIIRRQQFPASTEISLPQNASPADMMMNVLTGKADITFTDMVFARQFMEQHQGKLKAIDPAHPLKVIPQNMTIKSEEPRFMDMINTASEDMLLDGTVDRILKKHEGVPPVFMRVSDPYQTP